VPPRRPPHHPPTSPSHTPGPPPPQYFANRNVSLSLKNFYIHCVNIRWNNVALKQWRRSSVSVGIATSYYLCLHVVGLLPSAVNMDSSSLHIYTVLSEPVYCDAGVKWKLLSHSVYRRVTRTGAWHPSSRGSIPCKGKRSLSSLLRSDSLWGSVSLLLKGYGEQQLRRKPFNSEVNNEYICDLPSLRNALMLCSGPIYIPAPLQPTLHLAQDFSFWNPCTAVLQLQRQ